MPPPLDFNPMSLLCPLVAAFGLVCGVNRDKWYSNGRDSPLLGASLR
jgi:hypothetical protein